MDITHLFIGIVLALIVCIFGISFFLYASNKQSRIAEKCIELQGETIIAKTHLIEEQTALIRVLRSQIEYLQSEVMSVESDVVGTLDSVLAENEHQHTANIPVETLVGLINQVKHKAEKRKQHRI